MKKIFLLSIAVVFITEGLRAQVSYSCYYREYCKYNSNTEKYDICEGYEEPSLFVINKDQTMFTHTIETMKSTYYVNEKSFDSENNLLLLSVVSDVGNRYIYVFDPSNKEIRILYIKDGQKMLIRFYVKAIF